MVLDKCVCQIHIMIHTCDYCVTTVLFVHQRKRTEICCQMISVQLCVIYNLSLTEHDLKISVLIAEDIETVRRRRVRRFVSGSPSRLCLLRSGLA